MAAFPLYPQWSSRCCPPPSQGRHHPPALPLLPSLPQDRPHPLLAKVEKSVGAMLNCFLSLGKHESKQPVLERESHIAYLRRGLKHLPEGFVSLDASRPWLVYWAVHALEILDARLTDAEASAVVDFLKHCQNPSGGFGGGPGQYSHLAPTYAAVNALVIIGTKDAYDAINRDTLQDFLWSLRTEEASFRMHEGGEVDIRGVYCAVSVARLTNVSTEGLFANTPHWIMRCQSYEGGFSGTPGMEAHGGYTFCGLAALTLLHAHHLCDTPSLLRWAVNRQMRFEGGFQGRTNKLVDGCYSFWQGGLFPILHTLLAQEDAQNLSAEHWMFSQEALQEYLLICCQHSRGGLIDKPGKGPDFYHTCYTLSGMSVAQHFTTTAIHKKCIVGHPSNELVPVHALYNVGVEAAVMASQYFNNLPVPQSRSRKAAEDSGCCQQEKVQT
ncbi:protein farnesyltransferase subunit beta-like isoform X3 [Portunus trituberculatus]|uniref:protein farnesyltransferase subunit beta-like isoform X3 n=1 Tax=Portunus trituberculatus TaxID=210409 RepID=UPI001E1D03F3|nr:protein farnesyltransferase subunit beta-like isoform X3 [Portunus trituberculatus]